MYQYKNSIQNLINLLENKDHLIDKLDLSDDQKIELKVFFKKHPNFEGKIDWNKKDLQWGDFQELLALDGKTRTQAKKKGIEGLAEGTDYEIIAHGQCDMGPWTIYYPINHNASRTLASVKTEPEIEGKWCIAMNDNHYWLDYTRRAIDFFFLFFSPDKENPGAKFAISRDPLSPHRDFDDKPLGAEFLVFTQEDNCIGDNDSHAGVIELKEDHWGSVDGLAYKDALDKILRAQVKKLLAFPNRMQAIAKERFLKLKKENKWFKNNGDPDVDKILEYQDLGEQVSFKDPRATDGFLDLVFPVNYSGKIFPNPETSKLFETVYIDYEDRPATFCIRSIDLRQTQVEEILGDILTENSFEEFYFPKTLKVVRENAFSDNYQLKALDFSGTGLTSLEDNALWGCSSLKTVKLPKTITNIGWGCFAYCHILTDLYIDKPLKQARAIFHNWDLDRALPNCFDMRHGNQVTLHCTDGAWKLNQIWKATPGNYYSTIWSGELKKSFTGSQPEKSDDELIPF